MIELSAGDLPPLAELVKDLKPSGHAIQARVTPRTRAVTSSRAGLLTAVAFPAADGKSLRIDTWVEAGCEIPPYFDPMIAKVISWAPSREQARVALDAALGDTLLYGVETNRDYLRQILGFTLRQRQPWTRCLEGLRYSASTFEVISAGTQTTVQDFPGRLGYWAVGAAVRPDGQPRAAPGQRPATRGRRRAGNHHERADPALQHRCGGGADRRRDPREAR